MDYRIPTLGGFVVYIEDKVLHGPGSVEIPPRYPWRLADRIVEEGIEE